MYQYTPDWQNIKPLGRTHPLADSLWLAFSGAGAEFAFNGCFCDIVIAADNGVSDPAKANEHVRIAVYVDGLRAVDSMIDAPETTFHVVEESIPAEHVVRIVKLSETAMATCGIRTICTDAPIRPTAKKARFIEFIGDSITCGYGVDDEDGEHHFATATEDVTKAYAYRTAHLLEADYSMVSISGYGIISGYTATAEAPVTAQLMPTYYEKLGFSYGRFEGVTPADICWDFAVRTPDIIVLNLGTNDDSYCRDHADRQARYAAEYERFLGVIRRNNPVAQILCTLGLMGDRLYPFVEKAVANYMDKSGDAKVSCMHFTPQLPEDGYAADYHPSQRTHQKAADKLAEHIRKLMHW